MCVCIGYATAVTALQPSGAHNSIRKRVYTRIFHHTSIDNKYSYNLQKCLSIYIYSIKCELRGPDGGIRQPDADNSNA